MELRKSRPLWCLLPQKLYDLAMEEEKENEHEDDNPQVCDEIYPRSAPSNTDPNETTTKRNNRGTKRKLGEADLGTNNDHSSNYNDNDGISGLNLPSKKKQKTTKMLRRNDKNKRTGPKIGNEYTNKYKYSNYTNSPQVRRSSRLSKSKNNSNNRSATEEASEDRNSDNIVSTNTTKTFRMKEVLGRCILTTSDIVSINNRNHSTNDINLEKKCYYVSWLNYSEDYNDWITATNMVKSKETIKEFDRKLQDRLEFQHTILDDGRECLMKIGLRNIAPIPQYILKQFEEEYKNLSNAKNGGSRRNFRSRCGVKSNTGSGRNVNESRKK